MASHSQLLQSLFRHLNKTRCLTRCIQSSVSLFSCSTLDTQLNSSHEKPLVDKVKSQSDIDEQYVLDELSNLLPISPTATVAHPYNFNQSNKPEESAVVSDRFLLPEEKLRGVFLQKLKGKSAIESALVSDRFLLPEEKLRGVFLQKLKGKSAIESALVNTGVDLSLDVVAKVLNRGNLGGEAMIIFFSWAVKQPMILKDINSYNVIIRALGRRKFIDSMLKILAELRTDGINVNLETFSIVMDSLLRAQRVHKAIQMFGNSEEFFGFRCDTESLNVLLQCLCKRSHVGTANSYFNSAKGKIPFDNTTYNTIIGGWSKFGCVSEMEKILEEMVEDGLTPDCSTFSSLLEGLGRAGRIEDAVKVFNNLKENESALDVSVYNAMISNFISIRDLDEYLKYYRCLLSSNCSPNIDTYAKLILALIRARKVADALEMLDEMLSRELLPTTGTITSFIEPLCSFGPPHAAMMIYKKVRKAGCKISISSYKLLLMRLSRFGKCGMLLNIWDEMQESGYSSDMEVYEFIVNGLCNIGQLENAVLVMEESLRKGFCPSKLTCSKLNNKLLASNKLERAYKLFLKVKYARRDEKARRLCRSNGWHF
ncbi:putative pentatricopeptide repeat-containing protein At5g43820 [Euphorbia lathyris]|uniref:putative pentatricopeptide repeat-containing protein At5g43820 n=1 Tax=Euphorbia lathyris TaxID=212925 RepID=UPI003313BA27